MGEIGGDEVLVADATPADARVVAQIRGWRDELIDLSKRNRLLNFRVTRSGSLTITEPASSVVLDRLSGKGWRFHYPPLTVDERADVALVRAIEAEDTELTAALQPDELRSGVVSAADLSRILRTLSRKDASEFVDKGIRVLYLGIGMLNWSEADGAPLKSPLLMVPVTLDRSTPHEPYRLVGTEDDWAFNPALAVKLEQDFGVSLTFDELTGFEQVRDAVVSATKDQVGWMVSEEVVLSTFSFHKEAMYRDLRVNEARIAVHPGVRALCSGGPEAIGMTSFEPVADADLDDVHPPESAASILDADSTQRRCIVAALDGASFVIHGPPGTGKSQTIANVIAELLAAGKTVLFVSEKAAALDVVRNRLGAAGLGHYLLELHSHKATRREVASTLGESLDGRPRAAGTLRPDQLAEAKRLRSSLSAYAAAVNEVREPIGRTVGALIGRWLQLDGAPLAPATSLEGRAMSADRFHELLDIARRWSSAWGPVERRDGFLWRDVARPEQARGQVRAIEDQIRAAIEALDVVAERAGRFALELGDPEARSFDDLRRLVALGEHFVETYPTPPAWLSGTDDGRAAVLDRRRALESIWSEDRTDRDLLRQLGVDDPDLLDADASIALAAAEARLASHPNPVVLDEWVSDVDLSTALASLAARRDQAEHLARAGADLAVRLGADAANITIVRLRELVALGRLANSPDRPEGGWIDPVGLERARTAAAALRPFVEEQRALVAQLASVFKPEAMQLDVEQFYDGPDDLVPKLSRWSSVGRANRKQLQVCTLTGKVTAEATGMVTELRRLQRTVLALQESERAHADVLGAHFYRGVETDFESMNRALATAVEVLRLIGQPTDPERLRSELGRAGAPGRTTAAAAEELAATMTTWDEPLAPILGAQATATLAIPLADAAVRFSQYHDGLAQVASLSAKAAQAGLHQTVGALRAGTSARHRLELRSRELAASAGEDQTALGTAYVGAHTDWAGWDRAWGWATAVRGLLIGAIDLDRASALVGIPRLDRDLGPAWARFERFWSDVLGLFVPERREVLELDVDGSMEEARLTLVDLLAQVGDIEEWGTFVDARAKLVAGGLEAVVTFCEGQAIARSTVEGAVERSILGGLVDSFAAADHRLAPIRSGERDALVGDYRALDASIIAHAASRTIERCNARRPKLVVGESAIIRRESEKKVRHRPIQQLMSEAGKVAQNLRPCFMMSPLTVSQFLPASLTFDVVIFDEASQVRPSDAVNAIYRGQQLIVAGDRRQLPPTSFFARMTGDGEDVWTEEDVDVFESVLDLCRGSGGMPSLPLQWHYRSRHESLITFSNRTFYDSKLITYPSAIESGDDVGVELVYVAEGEYQRGSSRDNPVEAREVVRRVLHHADTHPHLTVGVVAFSEAQATRIGYELEAARRDRRDLDEWFTYDRLEGFFVKNLESVQGDERDIIIFSIGYGRDEVGKLTMNFGPLNRSGGERRLNVAVTRAKSRVEVVSSIKAGDISIDTTSVGVSALRRYLDFAERGPVALAGVEHFEDAETESPFEDEVLEVVRGLGYAAHPQVGQAGYRIDIGVRHPDLPGRYLLGIECDGAAYHSSLVARDRDRLRQQVLEGLGWRLHRVWGPSWYHDRVGETTKLRSVLERAVRGELPDPWAGPAPEHAPVAVEVDDIDLDVLPDWVVPYQVATLGYRYADLSLDGARFGAEIRTAVVEVVTSEGPISPNLLHKRVREAFGHARNTASVRLSLDSVIDAAERSGSIRRTVDGFFYTDIGQLGVVRGVDAASPATARRRVQDVGSDELGGAVRRTLTEAGSATYDELTDRASRLFGWGRRGADIQAALRACLDRLVSSAEVRQVESGRYERIKREDTEAST